jgi:hypothetical protein
LLEGEQMRLAVRNYLVEVFLKKNVVFIAIDVTEFHCEVLGSRIVLFKRMIYHYLLKF